MLQRKLRCSTPQKTHLTFHRMVNLRTLFASFDFSSSAANKAPVKEVVEIDLTNATRLSSCSWHQWTSYLSLLQSISSHLYSESLKRFAVVESRSKCMIQVQPSSDSKDGSTTAFKCIDCDFTAASSMQIYYHRRMAHSTKIYKCEEMFCTYETKVLNYYRDHMRRHRKKKVYACRIESCTATFVENTTLHRHIRSVHKRTPARFACQEIDCHFVTDAKHRLTRHAASHLSDEEKPFSCNVSGCGFKATQKSNLYKHIQSKHLSSDELSASTEDNSGLIRTQPMHICPHLDCGKAFFYPSSLKAHSKKHVGVCSKVMEVHACPEVGCRKVFQSLSGLLQHLRHGHGPSITISSIPPDNSTSSHWNMLPEFRCSDAGCGYIALSPQQLTYHVDKYHGGVITVLCDAPNCDFVCTSMAALASHKATAHVHKEGNHDSNAITKEKLAVDPSPSTYPRRASNPRVDTMEDMFQFLKDLQRLPELEGYEVSGTLDFSNTGSELETETETEDEEEEKKFYS